LRDTLQEALGGRIEAFELIPSRGGCFELTVDGELIHSKLRTGLFPDDEEL
jgi:selenoprotein W-related protein